MRFIGKLKSSIFQHILVEHFFKSTSIIQYHFFFFFSSIFKYFQVFPVWVATLILFILQSTHRTCPLFYFYLFIYFLFFFYLNDNLRNFQNNKGNQNWCNDWIRSNNFFKNGLLKNWINNSFSFYITTFFFMKSLFLMRF